MRSPLPLPQLLHSKELQGLDVIREMLNSKIFKYFSTFLRIFSDCNYRREEYKNLNNIIQRFHQIQTVLYQGSSESSKLETILGLIDVNKILDDRLQVLFKAEYHCPEEIYFINNLLM